MRLRWCIWAISGTGEQGVAMPSSSEVLATIPVGMQPRWVAITPDGSHAYVTLEDFRLDGPDPGAVAVIDTQARTITATIVVGSRPSGVVIAPDGRRAYVPNWDSGHGRRSSAPPSHGSVRRTGWRSCPTGRTPTWPTGGRAQSTSSRSDRKPPDLDPFPVAGRNIQRLLC